MYTVETETELYNRLVPWGIATRLQCIKSQFVMRLQLTFVVLQSSRKGDRKAELLETSRSNCTLMNMVNELDGLTAQLSEPQTVD